MRRRPALRALGTGVLLALLAGLGLPGAQLAAWSVVPRAPAAGGGAAGDGLPWLHVAHPAAGRPFIADPAGRSVILRGAVSAGLVDYWSGTDPRVAAPPPYFPIDPAAYDGRCPANSAVIRQPPLCRDDLREMRALGFDALRLALSWSLLEPEPGRYSRLYLDRIAQVVGWARDEGIYVILDMHENAYSRYLPRPVPPPLPGGSPTALNELSGAPAWATFPDAFPSEVFAGQRELNPAVGEAFTNFWIDRAGIQDRYLDALAALARRFRDESAVAGYGVFNEPWPGFVPPPAFDDLLLTPFYRRAVDALTGVGDGLPCPAPAPALPVCGRQGPGAGDRRHLVFLEPQHLREQVDVPTHLPGPISSYGNLVYAIHAYTHVFTLDALLGQPPSANGLDLAYATGDAEARAADAALFVDEFGNEPAQDGLLLAGQLAEQERHLTGSTVWPWKESCSRTTTWGVYAGVFGEAPDQRCAYDRGRDTGPAPQNGCLRAGRERLLARVWPRAVASPERATYAYDPATGGFAMKGVAAPGAPETLIEVPAEVTGAVQATGAAVAAVEREPEGGRLVHVQPAGGAYRVTVEPASLALRGCA
jgi:endoglycosylceramidase